MLLLTAFETVSNKYMYIRNIRSTDFKTKFPLSHRYLLMKNDKRSTFNNDSSNSEIECKFYLLNWNISELSFKHTGPQLAPFSLDKGAFLSKEKKMVSKRRQFPFNLFVQPTNSVKAVSFFVIQADYLKTDVRMCLLVWYGKWTPFYH